MRKAVFSKKELGGKNVTTIQLLLTVLAVTALLISNVITSKQVLLPFNITMTGAVFIFPVTYILSDLFSEVYGYKYSRFVCYLSFAMNLLMVVMFSLVIATPAPGYWTGQEAFQTVLGSTPRVLLASSLAFVVGGWADDYTFLKMKDKHGTSSKGFGIRAIVSSAVGELVDSLIFLPIAFLGLMPISTLAVMTICQVFIKTGYEVIILPVTTKLVKWVKKLEGDRYNEWNM